MRVVALTEAATIIMGQSPPSSSYNTHGDGLPFFQGKVDFGDLYPTARVYCSQPHKIAEPGDILLCVRAPVGPTNIADARSCIGRGLAAIRPSEQVSGSYLLYFLRFHEPHLSGIGKGSTFEAVGRSDLEGILVPLPLLPDQKRIAAILERADRLRRLRRYALQLSDTYLQAVFLEMFGDPVRNPKGWPRRRLDEVAEINPSVGEGSTPRGDQRVTFVPMAAVDGDTGAITLSETRRYQEVARGFTAFRDSDVIFAKITPCMENGKIALAKGLLNGIGFGSTEFHVIRPGADTNPTWLLWLVRRRQFRRFAQRSFTGTAGQQRVPASFLRDFLAPVPPLPHQNEFGAVAARFERVRAQQREAERQAEHLFQTLLQRAFRGEL